MCERVSNPLHYYMKTKRYFTLFTGFECLDTHDVFGEDFVGRRNIAESGKSCVSACRGQPQIGPVCHVYNNTLGRYATEPCKIHYCSKVILFRGYTRNRLYYEVLGMDFFLTTRLKKIFATS